MRTTLEAPAITAEMLAALVTDPHAAAVIVQDATGTIRPVSHLDRFQLQDPDTVVLMTRAEAVAALQEQARLATAALRDAGVIL